MSDRPMLTVRLRDERDGYDIEDDRGVVVDTVTIKELTTTDLPERLMRERVERQQRVMRVRRFAEALARPAAPEGKETGE